MLKDIREVKAEMETSRVAKSLSELKTWNDYASEPLPPTPWIVKQILVRGKITLIYGPGGIGKSFLAAHLSMCVAKGLPFIGNFEWMCCEPGPVLWLDNENDEEENRVRGVKLDKHKTPQTPFLHQITMHDIPKHGFKVTEADCAALTKLVDECNPALIVLDSLVTALADDMDENLAVDLNIFFTRLQSIITHKADGSVREQKPALLIVAHSSKGEKDDGWANFRGSSRIKDAVVFMLGMREHIYERENGKKESRVQFKFEKCRRGKTPRDTYEYAIEDRWEGLKPGQSEAGLSTEDSRHWYEFVPYGKVEEEKHMLTLRPDIPMTLDTLMVTGRFYTAAELAGMLKANPKHTSFRNALKKMVNEGSVKRVKDSGHRALYTKEVLEDEV